MKSQQRWNNVMKSHEEPTWTNKRNGKEEYVNKRFLFLNRQVLIE